MINVLPNKISSFFVCLLLCSNFVGCLDDDVLTDDLLFECDNGDQISYDQYNDGSIDCSDGSDEEDLFSVCDDEKPIFEDEREQTVVDYVYNFVQSVDESSPYKSFNMHMSKNGSWADNLDTTYWVEQNKIGDFQYLAAGLCNFEILDIIDTGKCVLYAEMITIIHAKYELQYSIWDYYNPYEESKNINQYYVIAKSTSYDGWGVMPESDFSTTYDCSIDLNSNFDSDSDIDGDGISDNHENNLYYTLANNSDTDNDGLTDYDELFIYYTSPLLVDSDNDGLTDFFEIERPDLYGDTPLPLVYGNGLVGYWPFDENEGDLISDYSGLQNNATFKGGFSPPEWTDGRETNAIKFDGIDDHAYIETDETLNIETEITLNAWIKINELSDSPYQALISKWRDGDSSEDSSYSLQITEDGRLSMWVIANDGSSGNGFSWISSNPCQALEVNKWHMVTALFDNTGIETYIDGKPDCKWTGALGVMGESSAPITLGGVPQDNTEECVLCNFNGNIDEVAIWNKILKSDEILEIYNDGDGLKLFSLDPILQDTDSDGLTDYYEINVLGSDPLNYFGDLDNDGLADNIEFFIYNTDPNDNDTNDDGINDLNDHECFSCNSLGNDYDSDGDGLEDSFEMFGNSEENWEIDAIYLNDLSSHWAFDEGKGTTATDKGYNEDHVFLGLNGPSWVKGIHPVYGSALQFDGVDDEIKLSNSSMPNQDGTISLWMKLNSLEANDDFAQVITGGFFGDDVRTPTLGIKENGKMMWELGDRVNNGIDIVGLTPIGLDAWYHVVFTWEESSEWIIVNNSLIYKDEIKIYINGFEAVHDYQYPSWKQDNYFQIGSYNYMGVSRSFFNGTIDEIALWERALNQSEIDNLYSSYTTFTGQYLNSNDADTDGDGLDDKQEIFLFGTNPFDQFGDLDGDGITDNFEYFIYNTDIDNYDTDGDGLSDYEEIYFFVTNPLSYDTDGDGLGDYYESKLTAKTLFADIHDSENDWYYERVKPLDWGEFNDYAIFLDELCCAENGFGLNYDMPMQSFTTNFGIPGGKDERGAIWLSIFCVSHELPWNYDIHQTTNQCNNGDYENGFLVGFNFGEEITVYLGDSQGMPRELNVICGYGYEDRENCESEWYDVTIDVNIIEENGDVPTSYDFTALNESSGIEILVYVNNVLYLEYSRGFSNLKEELSDYGMFWSSQGLQFGGKVSENTQLAIKNLRIYTASQENQHINGAHLIDLDRDGVNDYEEYLVGSDPQISDSDYDGLSDGEEIYIYNTNPINSDSDEDGILDKLEIEMFGTDPNGNENPVIFYSGSVPDDSEYNWFTISDYYLSDVDGDRVPDFLDNCKFTSNYGQYDSDDDGIGNYCDSYDNNPPPTSSGGRCYWGMDGTYVRLYVTQSECYNTNRASWYTSNYPA